MENDSINNNDKLKQEAETSRPDNQSGHYVETSRKNDSAGQKPESNRKLPSILRTFLFAFITVILVCSAIVFVIYGVPAVTEMASGHSTAFTNDT